MTRQAIAIIGTHAATPYGAHVAADLAYGLAGRGWTILTTGAFGIGSAALRGALAAGGTAAAVLSSGLLRPYPSAHGDLFDRVAHGGLLVSQVPPEATPTQAQAQARGRLLVALARVVVVIEAPLGSGALATARWATTYGRPLMAVPGPVTSAASTGCHRLLREGAAQLVTDAADVSAQLAQEV